MDLSRIEWRKASYSASGNCVEVGIGGGVVAVRDSKNPDGPRLVFGSDEWQEFVAAVKAGSSAWSDAPAPGA